jgi:hypothetical protein
MPAYTKLFNSIITSTIWTEDDKTRLVWITMLAMADQHGEVHASIPGLARVSGVSVQDCEKAIFKLLSPDPYSRTPDHEGRRIAPIDGGWEILNHARYRLMASREDAKAAASARVQRHRSRKSSVVTPCNASVTPCNASVTVPLHIAEAEAEAEAEADSETQKDASAPFSSPQFKTAWQEWEQHRREIRKKITPTTRKRQLEQLGAMSEADAIKSIRQSVANGWTGLFEPKGKTATKNNHAGIQENIPF